MDVYRERVTTAEDAVSHIQSGQRVFLTGNCSVPQTVVGALVTRAMGLHDVELVQVLTFGKAEYAKPELVGHLRINTLFISDTQRAAVNEGRGDFTPCRWTQPSCTSVLPTSTASVRSASKSA